MKTFRGDVSNKFRCEAPPCDSKTSRRNLESKQCAWCISLFIGLVTLGSTANRIRQLLPAVLPCSSEAPAKVGLLRPALRTFRFLLFGACRVAVDVFPSVEMSASAPDK